MTELIEVISEESKTMPLIVLLKDVEKSFTGITKSFSSLTCKLESLPPSVLNVGCQAQMDSRKEKMQQIILLARNPMMYEAPSNCCETPHCCHTNTHPLL